jgi:hypothetical protein
MPNRLRPDGLALPIADVVLYTPGMTGTAVVQGAGEPSMRTAAETAPRFLDALAANGFEEQLTVEIRDPIDLYGPDYPAGEAGDIVLEAPAPGTGFGQVLLYSAEDGSLTWHFAEAIPEPRAGVQARGGEPRTFRVPRAVTAVEQTAAGSGRGLIDTIGGKLLKLLVFPLVDPLVGAVTQHYANRWEATHRPYRMRHFGPDDYRDPDGQDFDRADWARFTRGPALLFLHGAMSRAHTGFQGLPASLIQVLHQRYDGRVAAFDHPTVSVTPIDNARALAALVPPDERLTCDIVAHARGGLVGRVLAERADGVGPAGRVTVRTLVMVATPNAGTPLAHPRHLVKLIDRITNIIQFLPDNPGLATIDVVLVVLKHLAVGAFSGLGGLTAMDPDGPFLRDFLNRPAATTASYRAVAADYQPPARSPLSTVARNGVMDLVFGFEPNDLIVPMHGVYRLPGAARLPIAECLLFGPSQAVDHNGYWSVDELEAALRRWLVGAIKDS